MGTYTAEVDVMLRPAILDVQGKTVENALHSLGYDGAADVRIGKHITLTIEAPSSEDAERIARELSARVLSNPIMENATVRVHEATATEAS